MKDGFSNPFGPKIMASSGFRSYLIDPPSTNKQRVIVVEEALDDHIKFDDAEDSCRDYHQVFRTLVQDYLQKLSCATELTIGTWLTEVLCMLQFEGVLIPELKCKSVTLELHIEKFNLYGAACLLRASTHAESLNIYISDIHPYHSRCRFELRDLAKGDNIDLQGWISSFAFPNLKKVKIVVSSGMCLKGYIKWIFEEAFQTFKISVNECVGFGEVRV